MPPVRETVKLVRRDDGHELSPGPVPFASPEHPLQLGWPFAQLADARLKHDTAKKREWSAQVAGDHNARERASLEIVEALAEMQKIRDAAAQLLTFLLRVALEDDHGGTFRTLLKVALGLDQLETRLDEVEDGILALDSGEALV